MIGFYDYTVILTYLSVVSASLGVVYSLSGNGHPYIGMFFLLVCGLCDAFDGKVARTKKNRTDMERNFGIQIDSLSDIVAFGLLPAAIGFAVFRSENFMHEVSRKAPPQDRLVSSLPMMLMIGILALYVLAALIRLAYFNVTEEERQKETAEGRHTYLGLPVTSSALIFPTFLLLRYILDQYAKIDIAIGYFCLMLLTGILFVAPIKVSKPGLRGILIMIGIGFGEFIVFLIFRKLQMHG